VQNLFVAMLGLAGSAGQRLRRKSGVVWAVALLLVTFLFWHTLLNPVGDPVVALASRNVQIILGLVGAFSVVVAGAWIVVRLGNAGTSATSATSSPEGAWAAAPGVLPAASATMPVAGEAVPSLAPAVALPMAGPYAPPSAALAGWALLPGQASVAAARLGADVVLESADGRVRGPILLRFVGPWVSARVVFIDPTAAAQQRVFSWLSSLAVFGTAVGYARWLDGRQPPDAAILGLAAVAIAWTVALILARVWVERHRMVHVAVFPRESIEQVTVGRNLGLALALAILLTPVVGLLYLALGRGRIVRVRAPFEVGRARAPRLRLRGSEEDGRRLERLAIGAVQPS